MICCGFGRRREAEEQRRATLGKKKKNEENWNKGGIEGEQKAGKSKDKLDTGIPAGNIQWLRILWPVGPQLPYWGWLSWPTDSLVSPPS